MTEMELYSALGRAVAKRRKELKLTQAQVAAQIGLTRASLANLETGRQKLLLHQVYRLVATLQLNSILDLAPAKFEIARAVTEDALAALPLNADVTLTQKQQVENVVRLALASKTSRRERKA